MAWVGDHLRALSAGDGSAWTAMWQAPIFAPAADALTFSEHFLAQSVQALPFQWLTGNPVVGYNVVFLATLALTALAAHLLTFRLSGSHLAGAVAGLTCSFNDYRFFWSLTHLHTLSIHWWILALWGLDRFVASGARRRADRRDAGPGGAEPLVELPAGVLRPVHGGVLPVVAASTRPARRTTGVDWPGRRGPGRGRGRRADRPALPRDARGAAGHPNCPGDGRQFGLDRRLPGGAAVARAVGRLGVDRRCSRRGRRTGAVALGAVGSVRHWRRRRSLVGVRPGRHDRRRRR